MQANQEKKKRKEKKKELQQYGYYDRISAAQSYQRDMYNTPK